jgi:hypothetical protein
MHKKHIQQGNNYIRNMKNSNTSDKVPRSDMHKEMSLDTGWILVH